MITTDPEEARVSWRRPNAKLIAESRSVLPELIAEVRSLREQLRSYQVEVGIDELERQLAIAVEKLNELSDECRRAKAEIERLERAIEDVGSSHDP